MFKKSGINWKSMIRMGITWFWGLGRIDGRKWELEEGATPGNGAYKTFGQTLFHYITHQYAPPQYSIQPFRGLLNTAKQQPWDLDNGVILSLVLTFSLKWSLCLQLQEPQHTHFASSHIKSTSVAGGGGGTPFSFISATFFPARRFPTNSPLPTWQWNPRWLCFLSSILSSSLSTFISLHFSFSYLTLLLPLSPIPQPFPFFGNTEHKHSPRDPSPLSPSTSLDHCSWDHH